MNKILITFFVLFLILPSMAQVVYIPDANFKTVLLNNAAINTNADTSIQVSEAIAYTGAINVISHSITDLTGISAFVNITSLNCYNNYLTTLDLSANTALTDIGCSVNQLTSLDLSANTSLTYVTCVNNQLTNLNLGANTVLSELYCNGNQLATLDVSAETSLTILYCFSNHLTSLDLTSNTLLTDMYCMGNPNLHCIRVADVTAASANQNWMKDAGANYSTSCVEVGITEMSTVAPVLFPNPANDELTITGLQKNDEWKLYNMFGQLVLSEKCSSGDSKTLNIETLPDGIYSVRITFNNQPLTFKLVKKK